MSTGNFLLVTVDSLRADHVGCYGYERDTTPEIDALAAGGHRFTRAFANAQATRASFPAVLTSTYPLMYGGFKRLSEDRTVLAEPLSAAGYRTGGFHSNPFLSAGFGYARGFDTFYDSKSEPTLGSRAREWVKQNLDEEGVVFRTLKTLFDTTERHAGIEIGSSYVRADDLTDRAVEFLREGGPSGNFLWVHYMDVHHPYVPPAEYQRAFREAVVADREAVRLRREMLEDPGGLSEAEVSTLIDLYDAETLFVDSEIGRLLETVEREWDDTVTVFTADHGEEFGEHGAFSHSTFHEEGIHVPLVIDAGDAADDAHTGNTGESGDTADAGVVHDELVALLDLAPTICDLAGAELPDSYRGHSLRSVLEDGAAWPREHVIGEGGHQSDGTPRVFYRDERWKYIDDENETALFDLENDPAETTDVSGEFPDVLARITGTLADHRERVRATERELSDVEMDEEIQGRLEALGYK